MTKILISHKVNDYSTWKEAFDNFSDFRRSSGEKSYTVLQPDNDPNNLTLLFEWDTKEKAQTFLSSDELKTAMQNAGVAEAPRIQFYNEVAKGNL